MEREREREREARKMTAAEDLTVSHCFLSQILAQGGGQKEKEEIHSLQEQLAALKEIPVGGVVIKLPLRHFVQRRLVFLCDFFFTW